LPAGHGGSATHCRCDDVACLEFAPRGNLNGADRLDAENLWKLHGRFWRMTLADEKLGTVEFESPNPDQDLHIALRERDGFPT
jgi:hypothetical protein